MFCQRLIDLLNHGVREFYRLPAALMLALFWGVVGAGPIAPPDISARSAVLINSTSGQLLYARQPYERLPPASTTKVLTALVGLERLSLADKVLVSRSAASTAPCRIGLRAGEMVTAQDLLYGLLLKSGNDAAEVIAEAVSGSVAGFAHMMNARAWQLGARNSHFANPHGLPDDSHFSTAYDLAVIFRHAMRNPVFAEIVRTQTASLRVEAQADPEPKARLVPVHNTNRLLVSYNGADGGKTGFTVKAKRCFVGEATRSSVRLIVAVLGSPGKATLWQDVKGLLDYGFAQYGLVGPQLDDGRNGGQSGIVDDAD